MDFMHEYAKKQKFLEINPYSPLIEGLLRRVKQLPDEGDERDLEAEAELKEVTSILIDGALIRSGFDVSDSHEYVISLPQITISDPFVGFSVELTRCSGGPLESQRKLRLKRMSKQPPRWKRNR